MAKRRYDFDEQKREKWLDEGRGRGHLGDYKPWLTIHDVPSTGLSHRLPGRKSQRLHHLLSAGEAEAFFEFDWADEVVDIREQFPLDRDTTREISAEMGVAHPSDRKTQTDIVMTTDFLLDVLFETQTKRIAWSIKPEEELDDLRTIEKLEIERRYWSRRAVGWHLSTKAEMSETRILNLRWLAELRSLRDVEAPLENYWQDRCRSFLMMAGRCTDGTLKDVGRELEAHHGYRPQDLITVIRHLGANKTLEFDLDANFDITGPVAQLALIRGRTIAETFTA
jgi:hypothetical protein